MKKDSFEDKMQELEKIVSTLETGEMNLEDSLASFEKGMKLSKECSKMLEDAESKIMVLLENDNGEIKEQKFIES